MLGVLVQHYKHTKVLYQLIQISFGPEFYVKIIFALISELLLSVYLCVRVSTLVCVRVRVRMCACTYVGKRS